MFLSILSKTKRSLSLLGILATIGLVHAETYPMPEVPAPTALKIESAHSNQNAYSGSHTIKQAIDSSLETPNWHAPGQKEVDGEFVFTTPGTIDYISFAQANFSKVELEAQSNGSYKKLGTFDLDSGKTIRFKKPLTQVQKMKMKVTYEEGANPSFSVREISFFQKPDQTINKQLLKVFKDTSCTSLIDNPNEADLKQLPELFQIIAAKLKTGKYEDKEFRMGSYKAYSHPEYAAKVRNINALNPFDNPTGIYGSQGDEIIVMVGPTHGEQISLSSVSPMGINSGTYPLDQGINKITLDRDGLLYVMYHTDISTKKKNIKVHIPVGSGKVNGYFDITKHNDKDWQKLIAKAGHSMFDIVGTHSMMILATEYLKKYSPENITNSVNVWDKSVAAMWKIMGFDQYPKPHNNRQLGTSVGQGAHMFATWYYCGYSTGDNGVTLKNEVIAPGILQGNRLWGIGHEIGHCYQHPFNWRSMSESSNNFFAQLILDQVTNPTNGNTNASDMENPCKYLLEEAVKGKPFHDMNGWVKWGFAQNSFYLYFHKLGINPNFYPTLFESLRRKPLSNDPYEVSKAHLAWYERVCNVAKTDFTDDFEIFNWFVPIDIKGHQYGDYSFKMTKKMADDAKARIAAKNYSKPKYRIAFMHQHGKTVDLWGQKLAGSELNGFWTKYKENAKLSPEVKATKTGDRIKVTNGENAAAFCVVTNKKVVGYYDRQQFDVTNIPWNNTSKVYAIPIQTNQPYKLIYSEKRK